MKTQVAISARVSLDELINAIAVAVVVSRPGEVCQWQADKLRECAGVLEEKLNEVSYEWDFDRKRKGIGIRVGSRPKADG